MSVVVARDETTAGHLVFPWPNPVPWGAEIVCADHEVAIICPNWEVGEMLGPGRHTINKPNPQSHILAYFVNTVPQLVPFERHISVLDHATGQPALVRFFGSVRIKVGAPELMCHQLVGLPYHDLATGILRSVAISVCKTISQIVAKLAMTQNALADIGNPAGIAQLVNLIANSHPLAIAVTGLELVNIEQFGVSVANGQPVLWQATPPTEAPSGNADNAEDEDQLDHDLDAPTTLENMALGDGIAAKTPQKTVESETPNVIVSMSPESGARHPRPNSSPSIAEISGSNPVMTPPPAHPPVGGPPPAHPPPVQSSPSIVNPPVQGNPMPPPPMQPFGNPMPPPPPTNPGGRIATNPPGAPPSPFPPSQTLPPGGAYPRQMPPRPASVPPGGMPQQPPGRVQPTMPGGRTTTMPGGHMQPVRPGQVQPTRPGGQIQPSMPRGRVQPTMPAGAGPARQNPGMPPRQGQMSGGQPVRRRTPPLGMAAQQNAQHSSPSPIPIGSSVLVYWSDGLWHTATIRQFNAGRYQVSIDGTNAMSWVQPNQIRRP